MTYKEQYPVEKECYQDDIEYIADKIPRTPEEKDSVVKTRNELVDEFYYLGDKRVTAHLEDLRANFRNNYSILRKMQLGSFE